MRTLTKELAIMNEDRAKARQSTPHSIKAHSIALNYKLNHAQQDKRVASLYSIKLENHESRE